MKYACTVYDIEINVPELYSKDNDRYMEPIGVIMDTIQKQTSLIRQRLTIYFASTLKVASYLTFPIARKGNSDGRAILKLPTLLIDSTSKEADTYILTFVDSTNYSVSNFTGEACGSGQVGNDFTSNDGVFSIGASQLDGTFTSGDKFVFAYETHEDTIRLLASYMTANSILRGRYVSEAANTITGLQFDYGSAADKIITDIESGAIQLEIQDSTNKEGLTLTSKLDTSASVGGQDYNINRFGLDGDPFGRHHH